MRGVEETKGDDMSLLSAFLYHVTGLTAAQRLENRAIRNSLKMALEVTKSWKKVGKGGPFAS